MQRAQRNQGILLFAETPKSKIQLALRAAFCIIISVEWRPISC